MEDIQKSIKKNKMMKHILSYFLLVILVILLFVPMVFRIVFKEKAKVVDNDVLTILTCEKSQESISSTFLNEKPQNILYKIKGNYTVSSDGQSEVDLSSIDNELLKKLIAFSPATYDETEGVSSIQINVDITTGTLDYELIFNNLTNQEVYYKSLGFSCNKIVK